MTAIASNNDDATSRGSIRQDARPTHDDARRRFRNARVTWPGSAAIGLAVLVLTLATFARAQNPQYPPGSLPPLQEQTRPLETPSVYPRSAPPALAAPVVASPAQVPPPSSSSGSAGPDTQSPPPAVPPATMERPNVWLPAGVAKLQALDKVNAQASELTVKVGQSATFGSLTITVKACVTRPADQPADAAAYVDVTDSHPDQPGFDGWLLADEPSASMMQHPIYDLRVTGCA